MNKITFTFTTLCLAVLSASATSSQSNPQATADLNLIELTITQAQDALKSKQITCEKFVHHYLKRIDVYDQSSTLNAIILINPNAIKRAQALDKKFTETGTMRKLHCIPVILKDNYDTADMPTEAGSIALKGSTAPDDAFLVKQLRDEDAIIIAKSNMGEWAFSPHHTISSTHGETRNPYDITRVPAGSSGGTASAIAANFGIIGMGTSTGNSIRGPSSHTSLVGIRATLGAMSRDGIVPLLYNRDVGGPLMRTVTDSAIVFSILAGHDKGDPLTKTSSGKLKKDYTKFLKADGLKGARLGVLRMAYETDTANVEIMDLMEKAIKDLQNAGATIIDPFEIKDFHKLKQATGFCSRLRYDLKNYLQTLGETAPIKSLDEVFNEKAYLKHNQGAFEWAMGIDGPPEAQQPPCVDVQNDPRRKQFLDAIVAAMDINELDAIIYPSWSNQPREVGDSKSPHQCNSLLIAPHTGQPALTVPMGYTNKILPVGLEFLARPFDEHKLYQYAYAYEQATKRRKPPKDFGPLNPKLITLTTRQNSTTQP